jgi:molecular chaperone DnaK (HSP70)
MSQRKIHLGIDFGTSYTKIAYIENESFVNLAGDAQYIPSVVTYIPSTRKLYFGNLALRLQGPESHTAYFFKLELKRNRAFRLGPYTLAEILCQFFAYLKEEYIAPTVMDFDSIAISVPNYFGLKSRRLLINAIHESIGVNKVFLLPEPIAALIGYNSLLPSSPLQGDILSIDIGGGTSDFSFLTLSQEQQEIIMETQFQIGSDVFSGAEIDRGILRYLLFPAFKMQHGINLKANFFTEKSLNSHDRYLLNNYLRQAEQLKIDINRKKGTYLNKADFFDGHSLIASFEQDFFFAQLQPIFKRLQTYIDEVLKFRAKKLGLFDGQRWLMDYILLLGGSARSQAVQALIKEKIPGVPLICPEDLDFNVVRGLCTWSNLLGKSAGSFKCIYPFQFYIEKFEQDKQACALELIPFDTANLELDVNGRYKIFSFSLPSPYNLAADSDSIRLRVFELAEEDDIKSLERFQDQELALQLDIPQETDSETMELYLNLALSRLEVNLSRPEAAAKFKKEAEIFEDFRVRQKNSYDLIKTYKHHNPDLLSDFAEHLSPLDKKLEQAYEGHAETTLFKLLCLLQFLSNK